LAQVATRELLSTFVEEFLLPLVASFVAQVDNPPNRDPKASFSLVEFMQRAEDAMQGEPPCEHAVAPTTHVQLKAEMFNMIPS